MSGRIVFMAEEESMAILLREFLPLAIPDFRENEHWLVLPHQGKSHLEASYPRKMRAWREPGARFVILRDNDGSDCRALKHTLVSKVPPGSPDFLVRIVCQELESWFLGDLNAVATAYPAASRHGSFKSLAKKDPDVLTNASQLLHELTGTAAKRVRAGVIGKHMNPATNRSQSLAAFLSGVSRLRAT